MRPHPLVGKTIRHNGIDYLITQTPIKYSPTTYALQSGGYYVYVCTLNIEDVLIAGPGSEYKQLTLEDFEIEASNWQKPGDHAAVDYFRHPIIHGQSTCERCKRTMHDHGWIDTPEGGHTVCPGDWIIKDDKDGYHATNHGQPWDPDDIAKLRLALQHDADIVETARRLGRTPFSLLYKAIQQDLIKEHNAYKLMQRIVGHDT